MFNPDPVRPVKEPQMVTKSFASSDDTKQNRLLYRDTRLALDPTYGSFLIYEHCMPFDVSRAFDEASGISHPRIWTAERDLAIWTELHP